MIERLERRKLLATINLAGSTGNDFITIAIVDGLTRISNTGSQSLLVNGTSTILSNRSKSYAGIDAISVDAGAGNDSIQIESAVNTPTTLLGGKGNDSLRGGAGNDVISGG
ncbi:MAG: hypothetical protein NZ561_09335, partial [Phycisphaerae bacterium]|nr:hypothetical protein [Phycisphaerae bacterium]